MAPPPGPWFSDNTTPAPDPEPAAPNTTEPPPPAPKEPPPAPAASDAHPHHHHHHHHHKHSTTGIAAHSDIVSATKEDAVTLKSIFTSATTDTSRVNYNIYNDEEFAGRYEGLMHPNVHYTEDCVCCRSKGLRCGVYGCLLCVGLLCLIFLASVGLYFLCAPVDKFRAPIPKPDPDVFPTVDPKILDLLKPSTAPPTDPHPHPQSSTSKGT